MSSRAVRISFGLVVILIGTLLNGALLLTPAPPLAPLWLGVLCEIVVLIVGIALAVTTPPAGYRPPTRMSAVDPPVPAPESVYRGAQPHPRAARSISKASAQRLTIGVLTSLVFTAATVPFAVHLPRWIEVELVVVAWWTIWSIVLGVVAYRGSKVADDHRPGTGGVVEILKSDTPKWGWLFEGAPDLEGCLVVLVILAIVGVALLGAWLIVELIVPAVFIVAYRFVVRALARAHGANTRGDALRSAMSGIGWATLGTAPLAGLVALVHVLFSR
jgi:hypothetical protein